MDRKRRFGEEIRERNLKIRKKSGKRISKKVEKSEMNRNGFEEEKKMGKKSAKENMHARQRVYLRYKRNKTGI